MIRFVRSLVIGALLLCVASAQTAVALPAAVSVAYQPIREVNVVNKAGITGGTTTSGSGQIATGTTSTTERILIEAPTSTGFYNPSVTWKCAYLLGSVTAGTGLDTPCPWPMTIKTVMVWNGTTYPVSCGGTTGSYNLGVGATIKCSPVGVTVPAGAQGWLCAYITSTGGGYPIGRLIGKNSQTGEGTNGSNGADVTANCAAGTGLTTTNTWFFMPTAITGYQIVPHTPTVEIIGDSIAAGTNASAQNPSNTHAYWEFIEWGLGQNIAWSTSTRGSDYLYNFINSAGYRNVDGPEYASNLIFQLGTNDIFDSPFPNLATMQNYYATAWAVATSRGACPWQTTILPRTSSTDMWATVTSQGALTGETVRQAVNAWIRTTPSPLCGFIDPSAAIEVNSVGALTLNGGFWPAAQAVVTATTHTSTTIDGISTTDIAKLAVGEYINCSGCGSSPDRILTVTNSSPSTSSVVVSNATSSSLANTPVVINPATMDGIHPIDPIVPTLAAPVTAAIPFLKGTVNDPYPQIYGGMAAT